VVLLLICRAGHDPEHGLEHERGRIANEERLTPFSLTSIFNEADAGYREHLQKNIASLPGIETLAKKPIFLGETVDSDYGPFLKQVKGIPTLFFVDPWGYIGVSVELLRLEVQHAWGSDLIFFFNYKRRSSTLAKI
jgi:three-Cys-motif partner protein